MSKMPVSTSRVHKSHIGGAASVAGKTFTDGAVSVVIAGFGAGW